ncbi:MAG: hypothetical protein WC525_01225 [Candidatus Thermoplasmatota archaeon]
MKITTKQQQLFQRLILIGFVSLLGYLFLSIDVRNPMGFLKSSIFVYVIIATVTLYMLYRIISGNSKRFPVEIKTYADVISEKLVTYRKSTEPNVTRFGFVGGIVGYALALAFTLNVMIFLAIAVVSGTGRTIIYWDRFGEMWFEVVLFGICFVVILIGFFFTWKTMKKGLRKQ